MTTGRTVDERWTRLYVDGYDVSGMTRALGATGIVYDRANLTAFADAVKGYQADKPDMNFEGVQGVFDNTATTGLHTIVQTAGTKRTVLVAYGMLAEPAQGDVCFGGQFTEGEYRSVSQSGAMTVSWPFMGWAADAAFYHFGRPFGFLLHAKGAETAVNTATGVDDNGAATAAGGYMIYQVTAGDGTATIKVQDAATNANGSFSDLTGATTGVIDCSSVKHGIVAATTLTVRRYVRWQIVFGTATTVSFALAFVRA